MKSLIITLSLIFGAKNLISQQWDWAKSYDTDYYNMDYGENVGVDKYGNSFVSGYYAPQGKNAIRVLFKYDNAGNFLWRKPAMPITKLLTDPDGYSFAISGGKVYKYDPNGNYSLFIGDTTIGIVSIAFHPQGGFVVSGTSANQKGVVARFDISGGKIWQSKNKYYANGMMPNAIASGLSGKIYCLGYNPDTIATNNSNWYVIKLKANGQIEKVLSVIDSPQSINVDNAENLYFTNGGQIAKYDSNGQALWLKAISSKDCSMFPWLMTDVENNLFVAGHFGKSFKIDQNEITNSGYTDVYTFKFDKDGNFAWASQSGGKGFPAVLHATISENNEIYFTGGFGLTISFGQTVLVEKSGMYGDLYIAKMNVSKFVGISEQNKNNLTSKLAVIPNPSNGCFQLKYSSDKPANSLQIKIINVLGAVIYIETINEFNGHLEKNLTLNNLKAGAYFAILQNGGSVETQKIIIQ